MVKLGLLEHVRAADVRAEVAKHPAVKRLVEHTGLHEDVVSETVSRAVLEELDHIGGHYVTRMRAVVEHLTEIRAAIHTVYERVLSGSGGPGGDLRARFEELRRATAELADPESWAKQHAESLPPLPRDPVVEYPGARPGLADKPTRAPRPHTPTGRGGAWRERTVAKGELVRFRDVDGTYRWRFPELVEGEVLHFPDYGYRAWLEPGGAIVEEHVVGPSVSSLRSLTRGEDVIFSASEMGPRHRRARTQRLHGAGSPGLGFDSPYGIARAPRWLNLALENAGIEEWVRQLRDNAPPGAEYVWTTKTYRTGQNLSKRVYRVSAISGGRMREVYEFAVQVDRTQGLGRRSVTFLPDEATVFPGAEEFGMPPRRQGPGTVEPPPILQGLLGSPDEGEGGGG